MHIIMYVIGKTSRILVWRQNYAPGDVIIIYFIMRSYTVRTYDVLVYWIVLNAAVVCLPRSCLAQRTQISFPYVNCSN